MFCAVALNCISADENYEDHIEEFGDDNNPWEEDGSVPNDYYRDEDRARNKDA